MKYKSQSMVPSLNHRHRKNKILALSLWIPEMSFVSLYHIYTVVFIYCCRKISLKYLTASYNPPLPPWNKHTEDLVAKTKQKISHKPQALESPSLNCTKHSCHMVVAPLLKTVILLQHSRNTFLILPCFLFFFFFRKSNGQRAFSSKQYI